MNKKRACSIILQLILIITLIIPSSNVFAATNTTNDDYLHTDGNKILDDSGNQVRLTGIAWFGFETPNYCFHGIWANKMENIIDLVANNGFNLMRVPLSVELVNQWRKGVYPAPDSMNDYINPELKGMNSLQVLDATLAYCNKVGLKVMLDMHRIDSAGQTPTWYTDKYTTADYEACWEWLANHYKNDDTVVAMDLFNEPHGKAYRQETTAIWDDSTNPANWKNEAQIVGNKILKINPKMLIMVEGIETYPKEGKTYSYTGEDGYYGYWWGGNLRGVKDHPITLSVKNQVVYSPHDYGPSVSDQSWFSAGFDETSLTKDAWMPNWLYIHTNNIAPVLIGEWGGQMDGGSNQKWMSALADTIVKNNLNHTFWCLNPNSGDTGGILGNDFATVDQAKYALVKPTLWADKTSGKFIGLDHQVNLGTTGTHVKGNGIVPVLNGDVNGDGRVNVLDYLKLKKYIVNKSISINTKAGDVNNDGVIDSNDLTALRKVLLTK
ncbi:MAG: cellulase family glycosylhydrolase [Bacillota bacterium]|nr:cellulase family glycosylhydrolase [Bacillota bacterium]